MPTHAAQANFVGEPQYRQHLDSAIHRKALAKEEARKQRERQLGANAGAAESAVVRMPLHPMRMHCSILAGTQPDHGMHEVEGPGDAS